MSTVYSYIRFSSKRQERGDSIRRQTAMGAAWLKRHPEHQLDSTISLRDLGKSAFKGANLDKDSGDLGRFVHLVRTGKIERGSILMLESIDRFSRQPALKVAGIFSEVVESGVRILTLDPEEITDSSNVNDMGRTLSLVLRMQLAHEESRKKGMRSSANWTAKRAKARRDGTPVMHRGPCWLTWDGKKWQPKPGARETLAYIFRRTIDGCGQTRLLAELQAKFPPFAGKHWQASLLADILRRRTVLGEWIPCRRSDKAESPVANYFPALIDESTWLRARAAFTARKTQKGRNSQHVNVLAGLVTFPDGYAGQIQTNCRNRKSDGKRLVTRYMVSAGHRDRAKGACKLMVEFSKLERHVLAALYQLSSHDLYPSPSADTDPTAGKRAELAATQAYIQQTEAAMLAMSVPPASGLATIAKLTAICDAIKRDLAALEATAAVSRSRPLSECRTVLEALDAAPEAERHDLRLKLRGLIAATVQSIVVDPYRTPAKTTEARIDIRFVRGGAVDRITGDTAHGTKSFAIMANCSKNLPSILRREHEGERKMVWSDSEEE